MLSHFRSRGAIAAAVCLLAVACSSNSGADSDATPSTVSTTSTTVVVIELPTVTSTIPVTTTEAPTTTSVTPVELGLMPLTGVPAFDPEVFFRPAIAAKIDNVEAARPQAGLVHADLVYEEIVEGGLTRLLAIFHSSDAEVLGPIRSARSTDVPLLWPLREPLFAWSGANSAFAALIRSAAIRDVGFEAESDLYERAPDRPAPSDLMTSTAALYGAVEFEGDAAPNPVLRHRLPGQTLDDGDEVVGFEVDYGATSVAHAWDGELGGWVRTQNGTTHLDASGDVIAPENVIVQFVTYRDTGLVDSSGAPVPEAELEGGGTAWFFVEGSLVVGSWAKENFTAASQYFDTDGEPMTLSPGRTWVLLPREGTVSLL